MSTILVFCVLATAAWLVLSLVGRASDAGSKDSVDEFSRALSALAASPQQGRAPVRRRHPGRGPAPRSRRPSPPPRHAPRDSMSSR
jgi:hypothetical protein